MNVLFDTEATISHSVRNSMFGLRKRVFCDDLGWDIPHYDGLEADIYDFSSSYYVNIVDSAGSLLGSVRLMPMKQDNLMATVFKDSFEGNYEPDQATRTVWEATRLCINEEHVPSCKRSDMTLKLLMGLFNTCKAVGIKHIMCNCNSGVLRVYKRLGLSIDNIGSTMKHQSRAVHCIAVEISRKNIDALAQQAADRKLDWPDIEGLGIEQARKYINPSVNVPQDLSHLLNDRLFNSSYSTLSLN